MGKNSFLTDTLKARGESNVEQHDLAFDDAETSSFLRSFADKQEPVPARGRGRPKGKRNRDNILISKMIALRAGTDPVLWMADILRFTPIELARQFECKPFEAVNFQAKIASELASYSHGKAPTRVEVTGKDGKDLPIFNMFNFETEAEAEDAYNDATGFSQDTEFIGENEEPPLEVTFSQVTDNSEVDNNA